MDEVLWDSRASAPDMGKPDSWENLLLQPAVRTQIFRRLLSRLGKKGAKLADLGAGPCIFAKISRDEGYAVTAVDARTARRPADVELGSIKFVQSDVRAFDLA